MNRLAEVIVPFGLRIACRRASCPTSRSPWSVKATTEGVVRDPSALAITVGSPPSRTAITELVVPRSIPTALAMCVPHLQRRLAESSADPKELQPTSSRMRERERSRPSPVGVRGTRPGGQTSSRYSPDAQQLLPEQTEPRPIPASAPPKPGIDLPVSPRSVGPPNSAPTKTAGHDRDCTRAGRSLPAARPTLAMPEARFGAMPAPDGQAQLVRERSRSVRPRGADRERRDRSGIAVLLGYGEFFIDTVVALALIAGGTMLLGVVVYDFVRDLGQGSFIAAVLELLSGLLLVFIFTELITTIRVVIARRRVVVEPFLIVGIVAAVRRLIVISAEAENLLGTAEFRDVMLEIGVLAVTVLLLGATVLLLRIRRADEEPTTGPPE